MPLITETQETDLSKNHARSLGKINPSMYGIDPEKLRPTEYYIYLYSVSKRKMPESRNAFVVEHPLFKNIHIPACGPDQRFVKFMTIGHPVQQPHMDPNNVDEPTVYFTDARRAAMSICNPDIVGISMEGLPTQSELAAKSISSNCDLIRQGVFFSLFDSDTQMAKLEPAMKAAEERRDNYYQSLLSGIQGIEKSELARLLRAPSGLDLRTAAEHFGEEYEWNQKRIPKVACPNCGERITQGAAFHKSEALGSICVLDWKKTVAAGLKRKEDVPDELRWWGKSAG